MTTYQSLDRELQQLPLISVHTEGGPRADRGGRLLGNQILQHSRAEYLPKPAVGARSSSFLIVQGTRRGEALPKIEELKRMRFTIEDKEERIRKALMALAEDQRIQLSPQDWRRVAEDTELEDQF